MVFNLERQEMNERGGGRNSTRNTSWSCWWVTVVSPGFGAASGSNSILSRRKQSWEGDVFSCCGSHWPEETLYFWSRKRSCREIIPAQTFSTSKTELEANALAGLPTQPAPSAPWNSPCQFASASCWAWGLIKGYSYKPHSTKKKNKGNESAQLMDKHLGGLHGYPLFK